ncbi:MAG TPA: MFS transporter [Thermoleophilia bacterium]|nr:MFS transporter [Thermoleophilia bacterium]
MLPRLKGFLRELRSYPGQFWVLTLGVFVYVAAAALAFPFEGIYLHKYVGASMTMVGVVFGLVPFVVMPVQFWGGRLTDKVGRRKVLVLALFMGVVWFVGFAFVQTVWEVALLVAVESAFGWPLFQTASNAMIADIVTPEHRQEAYSINRVAMNLGVVIGPATAALALAWGASFRELFLSAAVGCLATMVISAFWIRESRPASATAAGPTDAKGRTGYRIVFADRVFIVFCLVAVLPVFCIGNFGSIYSVYIQSYLHVPYGEWGMLLALNAFIVATVQYPLVRATRFKNRMVLLAIASALLATGIGGSAFAGPLWSLVLLIVIMSVGETLLSPVASAEVSDLAPEALRGRYMGVWSVVWNGGAALGPFFGGWAMDHVGGRQAFALLLVIGMAGAALFLMLAPGWRRRRPAQLRATARGVPEEA